MSGRGTRPGEGGATPSPLETAVVHDGRLDVLCCILDCGPLNAKQVSARLAESERLVRHWLETLHALDLVEKIAAPGGTEPLFAVTLDHHPEWVRDVIARHRRQPPASA